MRGVLILTPATLLAKLIGLGYKIPLIAIVGVGGMAYFLSAYHVYSLLFVLSAAGLPTALSLLVSRSIAAGERGAVVRIFSVSLGVFLSMGLLGTALLCVFAVPIAEALAMAEAAPALLAIAPALCLAAFNGGVRGLFQGHHNMLPTAICEVTEAVGKLIFGILFALMAKRSGAATPHVAAAAVFGITVGMALSALFLALMLLCNRRRLFWREACVLPARRQVLGDMIRVALPVTVSASVMSLVSLVDTVLISGRLQACGVASTVANAMYSSYGNLAVPLYNLVPALLAPVTLSLTPTLSAAFAADDAAWAKAAFLKAQRLVCAVVFPAILGLALFAHPILSLLYAGQEAAVRVAAPLLSVLAPALLPAVLITLTGAALQAVGRPFVPVLSMLAGAAIKLVCEFFLLSLPPVSIMGAPVSTLFCNLTVLLINALVLARVVPYRLFDPTCLLRPLAAALLATLPGAVGYGLLIKHMGSAPWQLPLVILAVGVLYVLLAPVLGAVYKEDLLELPGGKVLCRLSEKCNLLQEVKKYDKRRKNGLDFKKERI
ncbi:MAG: oligosaccharide flippase family protein [Clostridia bacterium]|nr:oligosaccharide flippase family protein [Clostridia bacterium]